MRAALLLAVLAAGCLAAPGDPAPSGGAWRVGGDLTAEATQEDVRAMGDHVAARGGDLLVLEKFPMGFDAQGLTREACMGVRAWADAQPFVATVGACAEMG